MAPCTYVRPLIGLFHTEHAVLNKSLYIKTLMFLYVKRLLSFLEPLNIPYLKKRNMELLQPCNTTWTRESLYFFFTLFQSNWERETEHTEPFHGSAGRDLYLSIPITEKAGFQGWLGLSWKIRWNRSVLNLFCGHGLGTVNPPTLQKWNNTEYRWLSGRECIV